MITKEIALTQPREMWHIHAKNKDGTPMRIRSNGKCKTWKRDPTRFLLPVKHGLFAHGYITKEAASDWCLPDRWAVEKNYHN